MNTKALKILLGIFACVLMSVTSVHGRTYTAGTSSELINAVNGAGANDTVLLVSDITLEGDLSFSKNLVVKSNGNHRIVRGSTSYFFNLIHLPSSIYINNITVEFIDVTFDCNQTKSTITLLSDYFHYVTVNSGAVVKMTGSSSVINSAEGAPIAVSGRLVGGLITKNTSSINNTGVVLLNSGGSMVNVVVADNTLSSNDMGAVKMNGGSLINCTVVNNTSNRARRYGVDAQNNSYKITNCIIFGNGAGINGSPTVSHSCVQGYNSTADGNINANPRLNSDFSLSSSSPCIDKGLNSAVQSLTSVDYLGQKRIVGNAVDMGACEYVKDFCYKMDERYSCGEPLVWIDGKTYTSANNTAKDTIYGGECDTIVTLDFKIYPPVDKSLLSDDDLYKPGCPGANVDLSLDFSYTGRTAYKWMTLDGEVLSSDPIYTVSIGTADRDYMMVATSEDGYCPDTTVIRTLVNYEIEVHDPSSLSVDSAANKGCLLASLDLKPFLPSATFCESFNGDTTYSYRVNGGSWVDYSSHPVLYDVADGTKITWRMSVKSSGGSIIQGTSAKPLVIHVKDVESPVLLCDRISIGKRSFPVGDSISGIVPANVIKNDILSAATDNCSSSLKVMASLDGINFTEFSDYSTELSVFEYPDLQTYWKVIDEAGLESGVCMVEYGVERATEIDGKKYAIVRDTMVCSLPYVWHGHIFRTDGETAEIGAALLTVKMDSSFFKEETVVAYESYTWRDGRTYTESTVVENFRQPNAVGCDSVFTLFLTIKEKSKLTIDEPLSPIDTIADAGCLLSNLSLSPLAPSYQYSSDDAVDTTLYYRVDDGIWTIFSNSSSLTNVADGTVLYWRCDITSRENGVISDSTVNPQIIRVRDEMEPILNCDMISQGKRVISVSDSVNGIVPFSVSLSDVKDAASDNCSEVEVYVSRDGSSFSQFASTTSSLNVYTQPTLTYYWRVKDLSGNQSSVCPVEYSVERETNYEGEKYAVVRDTMVCSLPLSWHGHLFTSDGETAEVGAALLIVRVDSSFFKTETIVAYESYTWRDGKTYAESTVVENFHQPNADGCDSVFTLRLIVKEKSDLKIDDPLSPIDTVADTGCFLSALSLSSLAPSYQYSSDDAIDTTCYYKIDGGEWMLFTKTSSLSNVADGTSLYWRYDISSRENGVVSDSTVNPQVIRVRDTNIPVLDCDLISQGKRIASVSDSVNGIVPFSVEFADVKGAASDDCSDVEVYMSRDGVSFSAFNGSSFGLNVFTTPSLTLYWKVKDLSDNESSVCPIEYSVERETLHDGKKYAIVRDTVVCAADFPFSWHGHLFESDGASAEVGAAFLTVRTDSSYYKIDTVVTTQPYVWRNGITYSKSILVEGYHQPNTGACDSVFTLFLTVKDVSTLAVKEAASPVYYEADVDCSLSALNLEDLVPSYVVGAHNVLDTTIYYNVDGGAWITLSENPVLYRVKDSTSLLWKVDVLTMDTTLTDATVYPQIIRVKISTPPTLSCDDISQGNRSVAVADSVNGEVLFTVSMAEVLSAANSQCATSFVAYESNDGVSFRQYSGTTFNLNVFTQPDRTLYWKVADNFGNISSVCPVEYGVERTTEVNGKKYAIVRDSFVCANSFPVTWHGHVFNTPGESVEVGAALLSVKIDSSFFRWDTIVVCDATKYVWEKTNVTYRSGTHDFTDYVENGEGVCDSVVNVHLVVAPPVNKNVGDTVYSSGCVGVAFSMGYKQSGLHSEYLWYEQGVRQHDFDGQTLARPRYSGYDNYQYMLITTLPGGYCPDTTVYITNSTHNVETGKEKSLVFEANDGCGARVRLRDIMPNFEDACSKSFVDTVCGYDINHMGERYASATDYYTFEDGDSIFWNVGILANDGKNYMASKMDFYQRVTVLDKTAPKVDSLGISYGNLVHPVSDSVVGDVTFNVPLTDVTDHVSDNCDDVTDLKIEYSYDGESYTEFSGMDFRMNVYDSPILPIYYRVTDRGGNFTVDSAVYRLERKSFVGEDSFSVVRDTMVCPSLMPFTWHGHQFKNAGESSAVGFAHLTVEVDMSYEKYDTVFVCESYVWRDGIEYTRSTKEPTYVLKNGEGECDSLIHLNLVVLNPSLGEDSIVVCVKELPYDWNGYSIMGDSILKLRNVYGCDSIVDVKVTVLPIATETIYDTACVSYVLNDSVYTESGVYEQTLVSKVTGCDSILTLHLQINRPVYTHVYDTVCGSYTLNDTVYTESGDYEQRFVSKVTGCDSILVLHLKVNDLSYGTDTVYVCEGSLPINWKGRILEGDSLMTFVNAEGCDSIVDVKVIAYPVLTYELTDTACGSYTLNEVNYNKSGDYVQRLTSSTGCDSVLTLHLTLLESSAPTIIYDTACGSYTLNDSVYVESGFYEQHLLSASGCDSSVMLYLTINPPVQTEITDTVRGAFIWNDSTYTESGVYQQRFKTAEGCDSIVTLNLIIQKGPVYEWSDTVCSSGLWWGNDLLKKSGVYSKHYPLESGEDSLSILHLTVLEPISYVLYDTAYASYTLNDSVYTRSGIYVQHLYAHNGCDSTLILNLKLINVVDGTITDTSCNSYTLNGYTYTETGVYEQNLKSSDGRDSVLTLKLFIVPSYDIHIKDTVCGSLTWNDSVYAESGVYTQSLMSEYGCDSIVTIDLTILPVPVTYITDTVCGSYTFNDSVYVKSGHYEQHFVSANGCDSLIELDLKILPIPITNIYDTVCVSYKLNDSIYTESGIHDQYFEAANGCDSIVRLHLVVMNSPTAVYYDTACVSYTANGEVYVSDTVLQRKVDSPFGCDSVLTVHLTILPIKMDTIYRTSCGAFALNDSVYTKSGVYKQKLISSIGCDSILTLYLTVLEPTYGKDTLLICENDEYVLWHGFRVSGDTTLTISNSLGCDSIVDIKLSKIFTPEVFIRDTSCAPYYWNGNEYNVSGSYQYTSTSSLGCDSITTLLLTILPSYDIYLIDSAVSYYEWNDERYDTAGIYTQRFISSMGCDSVVTKMVTILPPPENTPEKVVACVSYEWQGRVLTESGIYYDIVKSVSGEDSIVSLDLTINQPKINDDTVFYTICENELPFIWNGYEITQESSRIVLQSKNGCDSFIVFRLNILPTYDSLETEEACDSFIWRGKTYYRSGLYHDTLKTVGGCDSIFSLSLSILSSVVTEVKRTVCEGDLPVRWNEYEFYSDTIIHFPASNGCDSIIKVELTISSDYNVVVDEVACGDYYWQDKLLTLSGTYVDSFVSKSGCDSIVTLNLTVSQPYYVEIHDTTIVGNVYEKYGFTVDANEIGSFDYDVMYKSQLGCDSLVHLFLHVDGRDIRVKWTSVSGVSPVYYDEKKIGKIFCAGDEYRLNYKIREGAPDTFKISFSQAGITQGFKNVTKQLNTKDEVGYVSFVVPENIAPGQYDVYVQLFGEGKYSEVDTIPINIGYDSRYVTRMWNDVVVCDNSKNEFVKYQWKKDNKDIPNATGQYYFEETGLNGYYSLCAISSENDTLYVCGKYFDVTDQKFTITCYPVYANSGRTYVYVNGLSDDELKSARMYVYSVDGKLTYWTDVVHKKTEVQAREGRFVVIVVLEDQRSATCTFVSRAQEIKNK